MDKQNISEKNVLGTHKTHGDLLTCGLQVSGSPGWRYPQVCLVKRDRLNNAQLCRYSSQRHPLEAQVGSAGSELSDSDCSSLASISLPGSPELHGLCSETDSLFCD